MIEAIDLDLKKDYIQKQPAFSQLNNEETEILASLLVEKHFKPDETIVTEGDHVDSIYLIVSGTADVRHITIKDHIPQIQSLAILGPGTAIGLNEAGFYSLSGIRTATVVAVTDLVALRLSIAAFHGFALMYSHVNEVMRQQARNLIKS